VGGQNLILWMNGKVFLIGSLRNIYDMRQTDDDEAEILTDPWSDEAGIWRIDVKTMEVSFVRKFDDYKGQKFIEQIDW
jgi:hypothetical protein